MEEVDIENEFEDRMVRRKYKFTVTLKLDQLSDYWNNKYINDKL
jgi:hypothetical protein